MSLRPAPHYRNKVVMIHEIVVCLSLILDSFLLLVYRGHTLTPHSKLPLQNLESYKDYRLCLVVVAV